MEYQHFCRDFASCRSNREVDTNSNFKISNAMCVSVWGYNIPTNILIWLSYGNNVSMWSIQRIISRWIKAFTLGWKKKFCLPHCWIIWCWRVRVHYLFTIRWFVSLPSVDSLPSVSADCWWSGFLAPPSIFSLDRILYFFYIYFSTIKFGKRTHTLKIQTTVICIAKSCDLSIIIRDSNAI